MDVSIPMEVPIHHPHGWPHPHSCEGPQRCPCPIPVKLPHGCPHSPSQSWPAGPDAGSMGAHPFSVGMGEPAQLPMGLGEVQQHHCGRGERTGTSADATRTCRCHQYTPLALGCPSPGPMDNSREVPRMCKHFWDPQSPKFMDVLGTHRYPWDLWMPSGPTDIPETHRYPTRIPGCPGHSHTSLEPTDAQRFHRCPQEPLDTPRTHRSTPFPQASPRATDVPRTSKQSQAPQVSPGPTDAPFPADSTGRSPPGPPPEAGSRGARRDLPWHAEGGGRIQRPERKRRKRRPGRERGPPVNHPPGMCPDARVQRRDGSGGTGPVRDGCAPQAPRLSTDGLGRVRPGGRPPTLPGGDAGGCSVPPAPCPGSGRMLGRISRFS